MQDKCVRICCISCSGSTCVHACSRLLHGAQESAKLRLVSAKDFDEALKDVVPTVSADSMVIEELKQWAGKFGEGGNRNAHNNSLTYFI